MSPLNDVGRNRLTVVKYNIKKVVVDIEKLKNMVTIIIRCLPSPYSLLLIIKWSLSSKHMLTITYLSCIWFQAFSTGFLWFQAFSTGSFIVWSRIPHCLVLVTNRLDCQIFLQQSKFGIWLTDILDYCRISLI